MKRLLSLIFASLLIFGMVGCSSSEPENPIDLDEVLEEDSREPNDYTPLVVTADQKEIIFNQTETAFRLFEAVKKTSEGSYNLVISPLSISMFLSMAANGADGDTQQAILSGLGLNCDQIPLVNEMNGMLLSVLPNHDTQVKMAIANSLWTNPAFVTVKPLFAKCMEEIYKLQLKDLGSDPEINRSKLNEWIETNTHGLITNFIKNPVYNPSVLLNTCYFKAPWGEKRIESKQIDFRNLDGSIRRKDGFILHNGGAFKQGDYSVGWALYGNGAYRLNIILREDRELPSISEIASHWAHWSKQRGGMITLTIPEWDVKTECDLKGALAEMGMQKLFAADASFSNLTDAHINLDNLYHASRVITNKKGTEAAAVTGGWFGASGEGPQKIDELKVDRPFLYVISESSTGAILFIGEVTKL